MRSRGVETPRKAACSAAVESTLRTHAVGEAHAYVQGASLKACAALLARLSNSPATRGENDAGEVICARRGHGGARRVQAKRAGRSGERRSGGDGGADRARARGG